MWRKNVKAAERKKARVIFQLVISSEEKEQR
jgi:hypothetical protein